MTRRYHSMKRALVAAFIAALFAFGTGDTVFAQATCADEGGQRVCHVDQGFGTLNQAIDGDTTNAGARIDPNTIYRLDRGGIYILDGSIDHSDFHLRIYAEEGDGPRPRLIPGVAAGGEADRALTPRGDLTIRGLYVTNQDELGGLVLRIIRVRENDVSITVEDSHLDRASQSAFRIDGTNTKIYIRNSIVSNIGTPDSPNNGRGIDDRGNDIDSVIVENSTFYNLTSRALRDGGGLINYAEFNHNTFYNMGQFAVTFGPAIEAKFTNNVVINGGFYGSTPAETYHLVGVDSLAEEPERQVVDIHNNNFYRAPEIEAAYPDTVEAVAAFNGGANAYIAEGGSAATIFTEAISFFSAPGGAVDIISTYYADPAGPQEDWDTGVPEGAELTDPSTDVMPFDFSYSTSADAYTRSSAGQPLGALTWFGMDIISTSSEDDLEAPSTFALRGNYPNPFNPTTNIEFDLDAAAEVSVTIFDLLGREVIAVPSQMMQAGRAQSVRIDATSLASGMYVYQVNVRSMDALTVGTGRMVLLK